MNTQQPIWMRGLQAAKRRTPSKRVVPRLSGLALSPAKAEQEPPAAAAREASVRSSSSRAELEQENDQLRLQLARRALLSAPVVNEQSLMSTRAQCSQPVSTRLSLEHLLGTT